MAEFYQSFSKHKTERDHQIREWVKAGLNPSEIARLLGVSRQRGYQLIQRLKADAYSK